MRCPQCGDTGLVQEIFETVRFAMKICQEEPQLCTTILCISAALIMAVLATIAR